MQKMVQFSIPKDASSEIPESLESHVNEYILTETFEELPANVRCLTEKQVILGFNLV